MDDSRKRKRHSHGSTSNRRGRFNKRHRSWSPSRAGQRFWIMDCENSEETSDGKSFDIEVLVTRCELLDSCRPVSPNNADAIVTHESQGTELTVSKDEDHDPDGESIKEAVQTDPTKPDKQPHILSIGAPVEMNVEREVTGNPTVDDESTKEVGKTDPSEDKQTCVFSDDIPNPETNVEPVLADEEKMKEVETTDSTTVGKHPHLLVGNVPTAEANIEHEVAGHPNADDERIKKVKQTDPEKVNKNHNVLSDDMPSAATNVAQEVTGSLVQTIVDELNLPTVGIRKSRKASGPFPKCHYDAELPNGDCGDGITNPFPKEEVPNKFWAQRRRLFNRFDQGIQLDRESWYSVTPEVIANHISRRLVGNASDVVVLDPFCGCGGNAIAFASRPQVRMVVCVDIDVEKLKKAHHNAGIYGVEKKLLLVHGNAFAVLSRYNGGKLVESNGTTNHDTASLPPTIDIVFLSPPWGGIEYEKVGKHGYDLKCIQIDAGYGTTGNGEFLLQRVGVASGHKAVGYFLPRNINGTSFARSALKAGFSGPVVLEQNVVNGKLKTVTSYLGLDSE